MPTPLESFILQVMQSRKSLSLDRSRLAIGTDKNPFSPLADGVKWVSSVSGDIEDIETDFVLLPMCLSFHLIDSGREWSEAENMRWIKEVVTAAERPLLCHVFHGKAVEALTASVGGRCTADQFRRSYGGQKNATFMEVVHVLEAGYTRVTTLGRDDHAVLWR